MPKRKNKNHQPLLSPRRFGLLLGSAVGLFLLGEAIQFARSDAGQLFIARRLGLGEPANITRVVGRHVRAGLLAAGVDRDSIGEAVAPGMPGMRWRVGLTAGTSTLQINYAVSRSLQRVGAAVLRGQERRARDGSLVVTLIAGLPGHATHEIRLVRGPADAASAGQEAARLALVLFGFGEDAAAANSFFAARAPFAVAIVPGLPASPRIFLAARARSREVVLHLPLEPINYPQVNPGPGTLLVSMKPARITSLVRRYLEQAGPVTAVANHMGSMATLDMTVMTAVFGELRRQRLPFLHVNPSAGSVCNSLAGTIGVTCDEPDAVVDGEARRDDGRELDRRWSAILKEARARGRLIVMLRATPTTLRWLPRALDAKRLGGVDIVPLSALLRRAPVP